MERSCSPEGYNAETGFCEPAQKPHSGEPNEYQSLYRIGRSQESISYCVKTTDGKIVEEGKPAGDTASAASVGREAHRSLARGDGSDAVQQLDLRRAETLCRRTADGQPVG